METVGRATAMTVISAVPRWWAAWLRFNFARVRLMRRVRGPSKIERNLARLSFVHFGHWSLFRHGRSRYLLFVSNFNGGALEYIEAFSLTVATGMRALWAGAYRVPPPVPVGPFVDYIRREKIPNTHYWSAYPEASTTIVLSALTLQTDFELFAAEAAELEPERFAERYDAFLTRVQRHL